MFSKLSPAIQETLLAALLALGVILFQVYNVEIVGVGVNTLFGATSTGIWVSTIEIQLMIGLQRLLGSIAALGIIGTSFAFSLAVKSPSFIGPTIWSKVITLLATALIFYLAKKRDWTPVQTMSAAFFVGLEVDVFAFALLAGLPQIIVTSLLIRATLWAATMLTYIVLSRRKALT